MELIRTNIKILGTGCPKCHTLEKETINAIAELNVKAEVLLVDDIIKIMNYGVMKTPGLVINEKLVLSGRIPNKEELKKIIQDNI
ncbi:MAG: thioredoxin family protein [Bacteroidetes bacterium]|jgi:small redox-active disulfide protein 2|nr:thioredoxin family protein [Bacteroidota bacterium]MBT5529261.1 thioredoxin family protein [Cytophagia bacterium]MBT3802304.1 thioredoxin family protein [Bacteroidota bacterium]MBT3933109.1 thioredoxin family protein [Bacteroidota bacterium]MBT4339509.1 thioredoxin family protein [Bacteroidota bacterium]